MLERVDVVAYRLELPTEPRIHPIFHISQLKLCLNSSVSIRHPPNDWPELPPSLELEKILNKRVARKKGRNVTEILVQ